MFLLADAENSGEGALALSPGGMAAASLLDGRRTAEQITQLFSQETGSTVSVVDILAIVKQLDHAGLLETPSVLDARRRRLEDFSRSPTRRAMFQGRGGYPAEPLQLAAFLGEFFRHAKGPGKPLPDVPTREPAVGLVSPHIDINRGGPAYAWAYRALAESPAPDVIVALGVAHAGPSSPGSDENL